MMMMMMRCDVVFHALTLLVGRQERRLTCIKCSVYTQRNQMIDVDLNT